MTRLARSVSYLNKVAAMLMGATAGSTLQSSSNCVTLPSGAKAHSNPGGGDCLFYCLADVLSGVQNKTRGHRQVRAGVVAWMAKHVELLEQHWDHLGPDGQYMNGSFQDYLKAVRRSGAWAGWLELYAAGVAEDLNILILSPSGVVRFPARNEVGHFAVLKFELGHYEVVSIDQKTIAELWLSASDAKPSGGRGGGRSKASSLHLSQFDEQSGESRAPSSLHLSAMASVTKVTTASRAVAEGGATPGFDLDDLEPPPAAPVGAVQRFSKYKVADGYRWPCELCPFVALRPDCGSMCKIRYLHCTNHHQGAGLPGRRHMKMDLFRELADDEPVDWKCPLCFLTTGHCFCNASIAAQASLSLIKTLPVGHPPSIIAAASA